MVDKNIIRQRLRHVYKEITTTTETDIFSSNVPEHKMRNIVKIILEGNGSSTAVVTISKKKEDGTYEVIIPNINVAAPEHKEIPQSYSIEDPIIVLEGGTNLAAKLVSGTSVHLTVIYWDSEV